MLSAIKKEKTQGNITLADDWLLDNSKLLGDLVVSLRAAIVQRNNR